jgi:hypothetical protein
VYTKTGETNTVFTNQINYPIFSSFTVAVPTGYEMDEVIYGRDGSSLYYTVYPQNNPDISLQGIYRDGVAVVLRPELVEIPNPPPPNEPYDFHHFNLWYASSNNIIYSFSLYTNYYDGYPSLAQELYRLDVKPYGQSPVRVKEINFTLLDRYIAGFSYDGRLIYRSFPRITHTNYGVSTIDDMLQTPPVSKYITMLDTPIQQIYLDSFPSWIPTPRFSAVSTYCSVPTTQNSALYDGASDTSFNYGEMNGMQNFEVLAKNYDSDWYIGRDIRNSDGSTIESWIPGASLDLTSCFQLAKIPAFQNGEISTPTPDPSCTQQSTRTFVFYSPSLSATMIPNASNLPMNILGQYDAEELTWFYIEITVNGTTQRAWVIKTREYGPGICANAPRVNGDGTAVETPTPIPTPVSNCSIRLKQNALIYSSIGDQLNDGDDVQSGQVISDTSQIFMPSERSIDNRWYEIFEDGWVKSNDIIDYLNTDCQNLQTTTLIRYARCDLVRVRNFPAVTVIDKETDDVSSLGQNIRNLTPGSAVTVYEIRRDFQGEINWMRISPAVNDTYKWQYLQNGSAENYNVSGAEWVRESTGGIDLLLVEQPECSLEAEATLPAPTPVQAGDLCTDSVKCPWTYQAIDDVKLVALIIACEAGVSSDPNVRIDKATRSKVEALAIAHVIQNRMHTVIYYGSARLVATQQGQWDCYEDGLTDTSLVNGLPGEVIQYATALVNGASLPNSVDGSENTKINPLFDRLGLYTYGYDQTLERDDTTETDELLALLDNEISGYGVIMCGFGDKNDPDNINTSLYLGTVSSLAGSSTAIFSDNHNCVTTN